MDWTPIITAAEPGLVSLAGAAITALCGYAALTIRKRWHMDRIADAMQTAGGVAYDAMAAATRVPGVRPDYAAARAVALTEGRAALMAAIPAMTLEDASTKAAGALGVKLAGDPLFSAVPDVAPGIVVAPLVATP